MWPAVALSVAAAATFALGAPLSRAALPVSPAEVTFGRLGLAALAAGAALIVLRRSPPRVWRPSLALLGAVLYAHFFLFTLAAQTTTTAHALAIVYASPVIVALGSTVLLREPLRPWQALGVIATVVGIGVLVGFEPAQSGATVHGDLAAFGSGLALAAYVLAGRFLRRRLPLVSYVTGVYGWAALFALPAAAFAFEPSAYAAGPIASILVLGLVPLAIGHTLLNAAVRRVPATIPNVISTQEATGGVILGAVMFGEIPGASALVGAALALTGVIAVLAFAGRRAQARPP